MKAGTFISAGVVALTAGLAWAGPASASLRLLLAAGGGGGGADEYQGFSAGTSGSFGGGAGGGSGLGGGGGSFISIGGDVVFDGGGGGGAGWLGSGGSGTGGSGGGLSFPSFAGGGGSAEGGFGGGGGGGVGGGGGGGYSGGDGGDVFDIQLPGGIAPEGFGGGGGGSYIDPAFTNTVSEGATIFGNGMVEINSTVIPYTGGIYDYTIPATGLYDIVAVGAAGGSDGAVSGGGGAEVGGDVVLDKGTVLAIIVGGAGESEFPGDFAGGGGGGSFVWETGAVVPEPATWALTLIGFAGLAYVRCRPSRRGAAEVAT